MLIVPLVANAGDVADNGVRPTSWPVRLTTVKLPAPSVAALPVGTFDVISKTVGPVIWKLSVSVNVFADMCFISPYVMLISRCVRSFLYAFLAWTGYFFIRYISREDKADFMFSLIFFIVEDKVGEVVCKHACYYSKQIAFQVKLIFHILLILELWYN